MITVENSAVYADSFLKNEDTWYGALGHIKDAENKESRMRAFARQYDTDGASYNGTTFNRWNGERNVNVNRNDNDWNDNWWFAGLRNSLLFLLAYANALAGSFCV